MANLKHSLCSYFKTQIRDYFSLEKIILSIFLEISKGKRPFILKRCYRTTEVMFNDRKQNNCTSGKFTSRANEKKVTYNRLKVKIVCRIM